jgi:aminoglycoside phosphotransferase (APT) family kinase protein
VSDLPIDAGLVERLVKTQHPDLLGPVSIVGTGWDNVVARLGSSYAVRLPRRAVAAELVEHELDWLPRLELPVPFPRPVRRGEPTDEYPWAWSITPWFEGTVATKVPVAHRTRFAEQLGAAHRALHRPAPPAAPLNQFRGVPLSARAEAFADRVATGLVPEPAALTEVWEQALAVRAYDEQPVWVHGDSHPGNLLVAADGSLAALLDFGDICQGDPATDLAAGWMVFDAVGRAAYLSQAGADAATQLRARGWAALLAAAFLASPRDDEPMKDIGRHTVQQLLSA